MLVTRHQNNRKTSNARHLEFAKLSLYLGVRFDLDRIGMIKKGFWLEDSAQAGLKAESRAQYAFSI